MTTLSNDDHEGLHQDLRKLRIALSNLWYSHRPVLTTRGRIDQTFEQTDRAGFERGMLLDTKTLSKDVESILARRNR